MNIMRFLLFFLFYSASLNVLCAQAYKTYSLVNPSFEGTPNSGTTLTGWIDCGFSSQSPVDIQPGKFKVTIPPKYGKTYMGMVVRSNDTWERVSQRLSFTMYAGDKYTMSAYLALSQNYISPENKDTTSKEKQTNHNAPCKLRIWGGNNYCDRAELLSETQVVTHNDWRLYNFSFFPKSDYNFIILEAYYKTPVLIPYNGNILVDTLSKITWIPKNSKILAKFEPKKIEKNKESGKTTIIKRPDLVLNPKSKILKDLDMRNLKPNQIIQIDKLFFKADSTAVDVGSYDVLDEIHDFLNNNPGVIIEVGGHTNNVPKDEYCIQLSTQRAKAVVDYLVNKGINTKRLAYVGYGKKYPIGTNATPEGRKRNQRVEIKIISING
jgi:outer membrane protein OmpA-like peptidoglycan-associated protein